MSSPAGWLTTEQSPAPSSEARGLRIWSRSPYLFLSILTIASLLPFSNKAFHMDDPLFLWTGRHIVEHPLDPYGFQVNWYRTSSPMWKETKNPPLGCYFVAAAAQFVGWSERGLHLVFVIPALAVILGTYRLALRFTRFAWLAAVAVLLTPGFLVSASSIMCDVAMLAFWIWGTILWLEGFDSKRTTYLLGSVILVAFSALTKYFGVALVPLLAVYSYQKEKRLGTWGWYLLCPVLALAGFELWSKLRYGHGLVSAASSYPRMIRRHRDASLVTQLLAGLSFLGGCTVPVLGAMLLPWSKRRILTAASIAGLGALAFCSHLLSLDANSAAIDFSARYASIAIQLAVCIFAGIALLALTFVDAGEGWGAERVMLTLWITGTFAFATFLNWVTNARSILPLIPAAGICLACRFERLTQPRAKLLRVKLAAGLGLAAILTFWICAADAELADSARRASNIVRARSGNQTTASVWFTGHSGFQYYMQEWGAKPLDFVSPQVRLGDDVVMASGGARFFDLRKDLVASREKIELPMRLGLSTSLSQWGADFYAGGGPLPFFIGPAPPQVYEILRLRHHSSKGSEDIPVREDIGRLNLGGQESAPHHGNLDGSRQEVL
jgi:4-amino-4-deoxy-L-arabinose transferase-like glycosyltransferase